MLLVLETNFVVWGRLAFLRQWILLCLCLSIFHWYEGLLSKFIIQYFFKISLNFYLPPFLYYYETVLLLSSHFMLFIELHFVSFYCCTSNICWLNYVNTKSYFGFAKGMKFQFIFLMYLFSINLLFLKLVFLCFIIHCADSLIDASIILFSTLVILKFQALMQTWSLNL